jgi:glucosamine-6-phosphate deaminase
MIQDGGGFMELNIFDDKVEMGIAAAREIAFCVKEAIKQFGRASIIFATGASQFEMLDALVTFDVDWSQVTAFHLDEYIGLPATHPASFRKYLKERFEDKVGNLGAFYYINGEVDDPSLECQRVGEIIRKHNIDVACIGIGENGHLAFNDPPADFSIDDPYIVVNLDEACRKQQLGEGWFPSLQVVPQQAISMSIKHIMKSKEIVCTVPDVRKAKAVQAAIDGELTEMVPASILRLHPHCSMYMDTAAAQLLRRK